MENGSEISSRPTSHLNLKQESASVPDPDLKTNLKHWLLVPGFIVILMICGYLGYSGALPFLGFPKISLVKNTLNLEDPLTVHFDRSVVKHKIESTFTISPSVVGKITWDNNDLVFKPTQPWEPDKNYQVSFQGMSRAAIIYNFKDKFVSATLPKVASVNPADGTSVLPDSPIEFNLDKSSQNCHLDFKVAPEFNYTLSIAPDRKTFQIKPVAPLNQDTNYQVIAYESYQSQDNKEWYQSEIANFQFKTLSYPEIQKVIPADKEGDVNQFEPIKAYFSKPMKPDLWQNYVEITPAVQGQAVWEDDGKTFVFKPKGWNQDTNYTVKIKGGWQASDNSTLGREILTSFHSYTQSGMVGKLQSANQDPKFKQGKYADVNLSKQLLTIFEDGTNMGTYRVSSGKVGLRTPTGTFNILGKQRKRWSKEYHLFMPYWMQFTRAGHGIHELPEWPSGYKEGANHLGTPVSHGCVRLGIGAAKTVYNFMDVGTPVYIHY